MLFFMSCNTVELYLSILYLYEQIHVRFQISELIAELIAKVLIIQTMRRTSNNKRSMCLISIFWSSATIIRTNKY